MFNIIHSSANQGTLLGAFLVIFFFEIFYFSISSDNARLVNPDGVQQAIRSSKILAVYLSRAALIILTVLLLALMKWHPVVDEEQVHY